MRQTGGVESLDSLLLLAGEQRPLEVLEDSTQWSSYAERVALFEGATKITGDPEAARSIGASLISSNAAHLLRPVVASLRSTRAAIRAMPVVQGKLDAAGEGSVLRLRSSSARIAYRTGPELVPNRHDCLFIEGVLSQTPVLFRRPPATVVQTACQVDGSDRCIFEISWQLRPSRPSGRRTSPRIADRGKHRQITTNLVGAATDRLRLDELERTLSELMASRQLEQVLHRVAHGAGASISAHRLVLAACAPEETNIRIVAEGFGEKEARDIAQILMGSETKPVTADGLYSMRAEIASQRHRYGSIAVFSRGPFAKGDQHLLDAYGRLGATTLDTLGALEAASEHQRIAEVLGTFSRRLIEVHEISDLAAVTAEAAVGVTGADTALVLGHDEQNGWLATIAHCGFAGGKQSLVSDLVVRPGDSPALDAVLSTPDEQTVFTALNSDPKVASMLNCLGLRAATAVPVRSDQRVFGVVAVGWKATSIQTGLDGARLGELDRVTDQAAGAWEKALLHEQVRLQAWADPLTGLANRRIFAERLTSRLNCSDALPVAVLFCDIDRFKAVNDALGHGAGDDLLVAVARRLQHCVRSDDLVARLGGDEFTVLLDDVAEGSALQSFGDHTRRVMAEPFEVEGSQIVVRMSMGAIIARPGEVTVREVLRQADAAMYAAKARGGDRLLEFEPGMLRERAERLELEESLAEAARDLEQFFVLYQPQVDLSTGQVIAAEALVRWQHPRHGCLTPDRFLPAAEETGLVARLDLHVLREALSQAAEWKRSGLVLRIAVNFSALTLASADLVQVVRAELANAGLPGSILEIELTESLVVTDTAAVADTLLELGKLGISIAIDDIGTGYSSLALLHRLPAQKIKIDRSFVSRITEDPTSHSVVEAILLLADRLGQSVIAEGIETREQAMSLQDLGCPVGQGYLYARPIRPAEVAVLARGTSGRAFSRGPCALAVLS
ncbi:MAG: EAL domain-containing protein, partial [Acidimicrobiales bacterium]